MLRHNDVNIPSSFLRNSLRANTRTRFGKIVDVGPNDILCGRHTNSFNNVGNRRFRVTINLNLERYNNAQNRQEKSDVIMSVVRLLLDVVGARFLKLDSSAPKKERRYIALGEQQVREKVGHALRDTSVAMQEAERALGNANAGSADEPGISYEESAMRRAASGGKGIPTKLTILAPKKCELSDEENSDVKSNASSQSSTSGKEEEVNSEPIEIEPLEENIESESLKPEPIDEKVNPESLEPEPIDEESLKSLRLRNVHPAQSIGAQESSDMQSDDSRKISSHKDEFEPEPIQPKTLDPEPFQIDHPDSSSEGDDSDFTDDDLMEALSGIKQNRSDGQQEHFFCEGSASQGPFPLLALPLEPIDFQCTAMAV